MPRVSPCKYTQSACREAAKPLFAAAGLGLEPRTSPPEGDVLPLHHPAILYLFKKLFQKSSTSCCIKKAPPRPTSGLVEAGHPAICHILRYFRTAIKLETMPSPAPAAN